MKLLWSAAVALALCAPLSLMAQDTSDAGKPEESAPSQAPAQEKPVKVSRREGEAAEISRRELLHAHIAWQWLVGARVSRAGKEPLLGAVVGLEGEMDPNFFQPPGFAQTVAWLNADGKLGWSYSVLRQKDGSFLHRFREGEGAWQNDVDQSRTKKAMRNTFGMEVSYIQMRQWLSGVPSDEGLPKHYAKSGEGIHPVKAKMDGGKIEWGAWQVVKTDKGENMPMPGTWTAQLGSSKLEFALVSFEGYEADELPNPSWPYVVGSPSSWLDEKDPLVIPDEDLDYQEW